MDSFTGTILLKKVPGEKVDSSGWGKLKSVVGQNVKQVDVSKGELIIPIPGDEVVPRPDGKKPHNYRMNRDKDVTLYCTEQDYAPLTDREFQLLEAIKSRNARYGLFITGDIFDWGSKLKEGENVFVGLPSQSTMPTEYAFAIIRYVGPLPPNESGIFYGVEIVEEQYHRSGYCTGEFQGNQYFLCEEDCGMFVSLEKLSPERRSVIPVEPSPAEGQRKAEATTTPAGQKPRKGEKRAPMSKANIHPLDGETAVDPTSCFKTRDRVVVRNKKGNRIHGTVRWTGNKTTHHQFPYTVVGIRTDIQVSKTEFTHAIPGFSHLFAAPKGHQLFMPEAQVSREDHLTDQPKPSAPGRHQGGTRANTGLAAIAAMDKVSQTHLLAEQERLLREVEREKEMDQLRLVMPYEDHTSLDEQQQKETFREWEREHAEKMRRANQPLPGVPPVNNQVPPHTDKPGSTSMPCLGSSVWSVPPQVVAPSPDPNLPPLGIGSTVQLSNLPRYGVIRWIGYLQDVHGPVAGVELDEFLEGCTDGSWHHTGEKYFHCPPGRGIYCPLSGLRPDQRLVTPATAARNSAPPKNHLPELPQPLATENEQLKKEKKELERSKEQLQSNLRDQNEEATQAKLRLQQEKQQAQAQCSSLEQEILQLRDGYSRLQQEAVKTRELYQEKQQECSRLQQHNQDIMQTMSQREQQLQEECSRLEIERAEAVETLQQQAATSRELQQRLGGALAEIEQLRAPPQVVPQDSPFPNASRNEIQMLNEIDRGAWGCVTRGKFRGQDVAVKQPHLLILSEKTIDRLRREVRIMAQVRHPNLVRLIAAVFDDRTPPLIITELLDMNLRTAYETGRLPGMSKVPIFRDVAYALHYLHQHQEPIIHRDVSAPNVLLEALPHGIWRAKLSDFGSANLAKIAHTMAEGAIIYSAPETIPQAWDPSAPPPPQTTKIDVYSYGVLLCEVITSKLPDPDEYGSMLQQVKVQWSLMHTLIVNCTKRNPSERPTMAQVLDELNKIPKPRPRQ